MGWRGDGTGKYLSANPPTKWSRTNATTQVLRFLAHKQTGNESGAAMSDGVIRQWLVLGPVPLPEDGDIKQEAVPDEAQLAPDEGQKTGKWTWTKVTVETAYLDFEKLFGKIDDAVAFACTHIYSPNGGALRVNLTYPGRMRVYLNGKESEPFGTRCKLELTQGWNRLLLKVSPGGEEQGEWNWFVAPVLHAWGPGNCHQTHIAWRTSLPGVTAAFYGGGTGVGAPVIVGDRLFLLSEPQDLICVNKTDGKVMWVRRSSFLEAASNEERKHPSYQEASALAVKIDAINTAFVAGSASDEQLREKSDLEKDLGKLMKKVDPEKYARSAVPDVGFSGFTPSADGQFIYTWFANGVSACYDLEGSRQWIRVDRRPAVEHGFSSSPLLVDGRFVVFMRDLWAFDSRTGELAWQTPLISHKGLNPQGFFHGSLVAATIGEVRVILLGNGTIVRANDGKVLYTSPELGNQSVASPVVERDTLFLLPTLRMQLVMQRFPAALTDPLEPSTRELTLDLSGFPTYYLPWHLASPVVHDGLAYLVNNSGVLTVVDVEAGKVVYQKLLDLDTCQAHNEGAARGIGISPALAGRYLYFFGNNGAALVIEPGRVYKQVAKNKIESIVMTGHWSQRQERFVANPVFEGNRLYVRGEGNLYAIGPQ
jgi:outer membrane protein assembly factor BamB